MHITILTSKHPNFSHCGPDEIVLASLCNGLINNGYEVSYAFASVDENSKNSFDINIKKFGVNYIGDFTSNFVNKKPKNKFQLGQEIIKSIFLEPKNDFDVKIDNNLKEKIIERKTDLYLIFWDTCFEYILPLICSKKVIAYYAKPPYNASLTKIKNKKNNIFLISQIKKNLLINYLNKKTKGNIKRMQKLKLMTNICYLDTLFYKSNKVNAFYIPLTLRDYFKENQTLKKINTEKQTINIIGALGSMFATGSRLGFNYLINEIFPIIDDQIKRYNLVINFYGRGYSKKDINIISSNSSCKFYGFVEDIDKEVNKNSIALFFNNVSNYTGTYTRVPYLMSSGICIIAHRNLEKSVPELVHGENILLGETPAEISALIIQTLSNPSLVERIGRNARETFIRKFAFNSVAKSISKYLNNLKD